MKHFADPGPHLEPVPADPDLDVPPEKRKFIIFMVTLTPELTLRQLHRIEAVDEDRALLMIGEMHPEYADKRLCALSEDAAKGRIIRMTYIARLAD
jgi:hypothetical protein